MLALISLSLAVINLFPFLPLDGGHIFWSLVEKVRGRPVPFRVMERASVVGFVLVLMLFVIGLTNDIDRLIGRGLQRPLSARPAVAFSAARPGTFWRRRAMEVTHGGALRERRPGQESCTRRTSRSPSRQTVERLGDDPAIALGRATSEVVITWNELRDRVGRIAGGLAKLGVGKGDTVAIMLNNRPEFIPCDLAAVSLGAVPFSIYQTSSPEQIQYVVSDAGAQGRDRRDGVPRGLLEGARGACRRSRR